MTVDKPKLVEVAFPSGGHQPRVRAREVGRMTCLRNRTSHQAVLHELTGRLVVSASHQPRCSETARQGPERRSRGQPCEQRESRSPEVRAALRLLAGRRLEQPGRLPWDLAASATVQFSLSVPPPAPACAVGPVSVLPEVSFVGP